MSGAGKTGIKGGQVTVVTDPALATVVPFTKAQKKAEVKRLLIKKKAVQLALDGVEEKDKRMILERRIVMLDEKIAHYED